MNQSLFNQINPVVSRWHILFNEVQDKRELLYVAGKMACWFNPELARSKMPDNIGETEAFCWFGEYLDNQNTEIYIHEGKYHLAYDLQLESGDFPCLGDTSYLKFIEEKQPELAKLLLKGIGILSAYTFDARILVEWMEDIALDDLECAKSAAQSKDCSQDDKDHFIYCEEFIKNELPIITNMTDKIYAFAESSRENGWLTQLREQIKAFVPLSDIQNEWKKWMLQIVDFDRSRDENFSILYNTYAFSDDERVTWPDILGFLWLDCDRLTELYDSGVNERYGNEGGTATYIVKKISSNNCRKVKQFRLLFEKLVSLVSQYQKLTHLDTKRICQQ